MHTHTHTRIYSLLEKSYDIISRGCVPAAVAAPAAARRQLRAPTAFRGANDGQQIPVASRKVSAENFFPPNLWKVFSWFSVVETKSFELFFVVPIKTNLLLNWLFIKKTVFKFLSYRKRVSEELWSPSVDLKKSGQGFGLFWKTSAFGSLKK